MTIKKNGRLGQPQSGVDVYGKPKDENDYWGVQCKGRDDYSKPTLKKDEVEEEIAKALTFKPKLKTFIIATTARKDVTIEEFVRIKDQESCDNGDFEIILYCWEDLVDLIEQSRDTFQWYVNESQFKDKFDVDIRITTDEGTIVARPKLRKTIRKYQITPQEIGVNTAVMNSMLEKFKIPGGEVSRSWCGIIATIVNIGGEVLEDWKFHLDFFEVQKVIEELPKALYAARLVSKNTTVWAYPEIMRIRYAPLENRPLIQKDSRSFECFFIPNFNASHVRIRWQLLARDFHREGEVQIKIEPDFKVSTEILQVDTIEEVRTEEIISEYLTLKH